jgi:hemerythrin
MTAEARDIVWTEDLSVGHRTLDGQHKELIRLINHFGRGELGSEQMAESIEALIAYAARHFNAEEKFIQGSAPHLLAHQIECHAQFIETAYDFAHRFHEGEGEDLRKRVHAFLCDWLVGHILEEDQQYNPKRA